MYKKLFMVMVFIAGFSLLTLFAKFIAYMLVVSCWVLIPITIISLTTIGLILKYDKPQPVKEENKTDETYAGNNINTKGV